MTRRPRLAIDDLRPWIVATFDRAAGPGGQNVNKVATRVTLLLDFRACPHLRETDKDRLAEQCRARLDREGRLRVVCQTGRTQAGNRAAAEDRLLELVRRAQVVPRVRRPTAPTRGSQRRRLESKKHRGARKRERQRPGGE